jgi:hypothetical protein
MCYLAVIVIITPTIDFIECFFSWGFWNLDQNSWDLAGCLFSTHMACLVYPAVASDSIINGLQ